MASDAVRETGGQLSNAVTRAAFASATTPNVFDCTAAEDVLPKILTGYELVPGVAFSSAISGPWDQMGSHRIIHLTDRSTLTEGLTDYDRPTHFACRVSEPSFALRYLMTEVRERFWFEAANGGTRIRWTYTFQARNFLAKLPLTLFMKSK